MTNRYEEYENDIKKAYEEGVTVEEAERLAAKFLYGWMQVTKEIKERDMDARMRKSGVKAIKAGVYLDASTKQEKKPTEATLDALVHTSKLVQDNQQGFDQAEVDRDELQSYANIFREAHVYYRGIAKGAFGG